jgi:hypothetical protein
MARIPRGYASDLACFKSKCRVAMCNVRELGHFKACPLSFNRCSDDASRTGRFRDRDG